MPGDDLDAFIREYAADLVRPGDILFVTEKIVAITQGRSYLVEDIHPRPLARFLSRFVVKTSYGIGLGMPETMEMALRECGVPRILFAAAVSAVTKAFGRKGDFYRIAGDKARAIDGPTSGTIPWMDVQTRTATSADFTRILTPSHRAWVPKIRLNPVIGLSFLADGLTAFVAR